MTRSRWLKGLAIAYVILDLLHFGDHQRQGRVVAPQIYGLGTVGLIAAVAVTVVILREMRAAALLAVGFGILAAGGVFVTHILPAWGYLSDSYVPLRLDAWSWISAWSLVVAALGLALVGLSLLARPKPA